MNAERVIVVGGHGAELALVAERLAGLFETERFEVVIIGADNPRPPNPLPPAPFEWEPKRQRLAKTKGDRSWVARNRHPTSPRKR